MQSQRKPLLETAGQYEPNAIYITLKSRGALPGFHWGIFVPKTRAQEAIGDLWHATNEQGGWHLEHLPQSKISTALALILAFKISTVDYFQHQEQLCKSLELVPIGSHSVNFSEPFSCRVWVKDALVALKQNDIITLPEPVDAIEKRLIKLGEELRAGRETGGPVCIFNQLHTAHEENNSEL